MTWELAKEERDFRSNSHSTPQFRIIRLFSRSESKQSEFKTNPRFPAKNTSLVQWLLSLPRSLAYSTKKVMLR